MTREELIEAAASAHRARRPTGEIATHPAWHDLDEAGREESFAVATATRALEAALDPDGLSSTGRAVLQRIRNTPR